MRRIGIIALATAGLLVGLVLPAVAQQFPVTFSGPVVAGQTITLQCPEGHQVQLAAGVPNAAATFYKAANRKHIIRSDAPTSSTTTSVSWLVPKGAKYADATLYCEPIPPPEEIVTVQTEGIVISGTSIVNCPPETNPYLVSVIEVLVDIDRNYATTDDQFTPAYETTTTGVTFVGPGGALYRVTLTCSDQPQS